MEILQNFVAISEYMNFTRTWKIVTFRYYVMIYVMLTWISRSFKSISRHLNYYFNKHICLLTLMFVQQRLGQSKNVYVSVQWIKSELSRLKWFWKPTLFLQWVKNYDFYLSRVVVHGLVSESKGQLISKCLFGIFNFLKKQNENKSTWGFTVVK